MISVNGKEYKEAELTFNAVCELEEMGCPLTSIRSNTFNVARAYLALCMGGGNNAKELAGQEIQKHILAGGDISAIAEAFGKAIENSDFFQALNKSKETETTALESKKK